MFFSESKQPIHRANVDKFVSRYKPTFRTQAGMCHFAFEDKQEADAWLEVLKNYLQQQEFEDIKLARVVTYEYRDRHGFRFGLTQDQWDFINSSKAKEARLSKQQLAAPLAVNPLLMRSEFERLTALVTDTVLKTDGTHRFCFQCRDDALAFLKLVHRILARTKEAKGLPSQLTLEEGNEFGFELSHQQFRMLQKCYWGQVYGTDEVVYVKSLRADQRCFFNDFKKMVISVKGEPRHKPQLRFGQKKKITIIGAVKHRRPKPPMYSPEEKKGFSAIQSTSVIVRDAHDFLPVFKHRSDRKGVSVGVLLREEHVRENRRLVYDKGTVLRPFECDTEKEADALIKELTNAEKPVMFTTRGSFLAHLQKKKKSKIHNEVLARIKFTKNDSVGIFEDSLNSRLVAIMLARQLSKRLALANEMMEQKSENAPIPEKMPIVDVPIRYYLPDHIKTFTIYTKQQQKQDRLEAIQIAQNETVWRKRIKRGESSKDSEPDYFFLLGLDENKDLLKKILLEKVDNDKNASPQKLLLIQKIYKDGYVALANELLMLANIRFESLNWDEIITQKTHPTFVSYLALEHKALFKKCSKAFVNSINKSDDSALTLAAQHNKLVLLKALLINQNLEIKHVDCNGMSALYLACKHGYLDFVTTLLKAKADVNQICKSNAKTPLFVAAQNGHLKVVRHLIKTGANVNQGRTDNGATPLCVAAENGHLEVVKYLIEKNAKVNQGCIYDGVTPLYLAAQNGHLEVVRYLIEQGANINQGRTDSDETPLSAAVEYGHIEVVKYLVNKGAKFNLSCTYNGVTLLFMAAQNGHLEMVRYLIEQGANINQGRTDNGETPLCVTAKNDHPEVVRYLIEQGANINQGRTDNGRTPLFMAALNGHLQVVKYLIEQGANINQGCTNNDETPLFAAINSCHLDMVKVLIEAHTNNYQNGKTTVTPLQFINSPCQMDLDIFEFHAKYLKGSLSVDLLKKYGKAFLKRFTPLDAALFCGYKKIILYLITQFEGAKYSPITAEYASLKQLSPLELGLLFAKGNNKNLLESKKEKQCRFDFELDYLKNLLRKLRRKQLQQDREQHKKNAIDILNNLVKDLLEEQIQQNRSFSFFTSKARKSEKLEDINSLHYLAQLIKEGIVPDTAKNIIDRIIRNNRNDFNLCSLAQSYKDITSLVSIHRTPIKDNCNYMPPG